MSSSCRFRFFFVVGVLLILIAVLRAAPGGLDPDFAGSGFMEFTTGQGAERAWAAARQPDGKLLLAGHCVDGRLGLCMAVLRLDPDGAPDSSFGEDGRVLLRAGAVRSEADAVLALPGGKILLAGSRRDTDDNTDFALARLLADGSRDASFGDHGLIAYDRMAVDVFVALQETDDGKILALGRTSPISGVVARLLADGTPDPSFGENGWVTMEGMLPAALTVADGGRILTAGLVPKNEGWLMQVRALQSHGAIDPAFGEAGTFTLAGVAHSEAAAIAIQPGDADRGGKILVAGRCNQEPDTAWLLVRLSPEGMLDQAFGEGGVVVTQPGEGADAATALWVETDGAGVPHILTAGHASLPNPGGEPVTQGMIVKHALDGSYEETFGDRGVARLPGPADGVEIRAALAQSGQVLVAGSILERHRGGRDFWLARVDTGSGQVDETFGEHGARRYDLSHGHVELRDVTLGPEGRILLAGSITNNINTRIFLTRLLPDGAPDPSFGEAGRIIPPLDETSAGRATAHMAHSVRRQPDGRIVVAGEAFEDTRHAFLVRRWLENGTPDPEFGEEGVVITSWEEGAGAASALAVQPDGKLLAAGYHEQAGKKRMAVVRYLPDGALDPEFGDGGLVRSPGSASPAEAADLLVLPDGRILAGGFAGRDQPCFALWRLLPDGSPDDSFGHAGVVLTAIGESAQGRAMARQPDGKIILSGVSSVGGTGRLTLARYESDGTLDGAFGEQGIVIPDPGAAYSAGDAVAVEADGHVLVAGVFQDDLHSTAVWFRLRPDGSLDAAFGEGGRAAPRQDASGPESVAALALDSQGRAAVARLLTRETTPAIPLAVTSITRPNFWHIRLTGTGTPGVPHRLWIGPALDSLHPVIPITPNPEGFWQYDDSYTPDLPQRFYRLSRP